jgi:hypothetical protein
VVKLSNKDIKSISWYSRKIGSGKLNGKDFSPVNVNSEKHLKPFVSGRDRAVKLYSHEL